MDRIYIRDLMLRCIIGIYPHERREKQDVIVSIVMECDFSKAQKSDAIEDAVNYKTIKKNVVRLVERSQFNLVEKLVNEIARICLKDKRVQSVTVTLDKPGALRFARSVAVEVTRTRSR